MSKETIPVCFRVYRDNEDVVAIFPTIPESLDGYKCAVYAHMGGHGSADPHDMVVITKPATWNSLMPLYMELISIGYNNLRIVQKVNTSHYLRMRREEITRQRGEK